MDIKEYRYILTVVECGSISEAARQLYISQPSLSTYIRNLESRAGIKFFHKVDGQLHLTTSGKIYLDYARKIVGLDESLMLELRKVENLAGGEVNMGITATRGTLYLHKILPELARRYPDISVKFTESSADHIETLLHQRKIDFALLNRPFRTHEFEYDLLFQEEIAVTIPAHFPVCLKAVERPDRELPWIDLRELKDEPFVLLKKGHRMRLAADMLFEQAGISPRVLWETSSAMTAYNLAAAGMGLFMVTIGYGLLQPNPSVRFFSVGDPPIRFEMVVAYPNREHLSKTTKAVIGAIRQILVGPGRA